MTQTGQANYAYSSQTQAVKTFRGTEYDAFARVTSGLKSAQAERPDKVPGKMTALAGAIDRNRHLWTILAQDVADNDNPLPGELRARILYLAEFTRLHSRKVLMEGASVEPLIDINTAVMSGLRDRALVE